MENEVRWIQGDGGPSIVLQATAVLQWQGAGATAFEDSPMGGGSIETDYDVICRGEGGVTVIERYGPDMLVLSDSQWATCFVSTTAGDVAIVQCFGSDSEPGELVSRLTATPPSTTLRFTMRDTALRLLVGADSGNGDIYSFSEIEVPPGEKMCAVYYSNEAQVVILRPAEPGAATDVPASGSTSLLG